MSQKKTVRQKASHHKSSYSESSRQVEKQTFNRILLWAGPRILAVVLGWGGLVSPADATAAEALPPEISVAEAAVLRDEGVLALDVREPHEWVESHIPGATLIPLGELAARVDEIPRDRKIVVVCRSGNRSAKGRDILLAAGFRQVTNMAGGIIQWKAAGFPTVSGP